MNYTSTAVKRHGVQYVADNCDTVALVLNPLKSDSFAAFQAKLIATAAITPADFSFTASGEDLLVTINGKSGIDPTGTALDTDDLSIAYYDSVGQTVELVGDIVDRNITNADGDTVNIPQFQMYIREATAVAA